MTITLRRELEQLHGKLKKIQTLTLGHAIGLHSVPPSSHPRATSFPGSLFFPSLEWEKGSKEGKKRDPGNEVEKRAAHF